MGISAQTLRIVLAAKSAKTGQTYQAPVSQQQATSVVQKSVLPTKSNVAPVTVAVQTQGGGTTYITSRLPGGAQPGATVVATTPTTAPGIYGGTKSSPSPKFSTPILSTSSGQAAPLTSQQVQEYTSQQVLSTSLQAQNVAQQAAQQFQKEAITKQQTQMQQTQQPSYTSVSGIAAQSAFQKAITPPTFETQKSVTPYEKSKAFQVQQEQELARKSSIAKTFIKKGEYGKGLLAEFQAISAASGVAVGGVAAFGTGIFQALRHPIETVKGVGAAVRDPFGTIKAYGEEFRESPLSTSTELLAGFFIPTTAVKVVAKGGQLVKARVALTEFKGKGFVSPEQAAGTGGGKISYPLTPFRSIKLRELSVQQASGAGESKILLEKPGIFGSKTYEASIKRTPEGKATYELREMKALPQSLQTTIKNIGESISDYKARIAEASKFHKESQQINFARAEQLTQKQIQYAEVGKRIDIQKAESDLKNIRVNYEIKAKNIQEQYDRTTLSKVKARLLRQKTKLDNEQLIGEILLQKRLKDIQTKSINVVSVKPEVSAFPSPLQVAVKGLKFKPRQHYISEKIIKTGEIAGKQTKIIPKLIKQRLEPAVIKLQEFGEFTADSQRSVLLFEQKAAQELRGKTFSYKKVSPSRSEINVGKLKVQTATRLAGRVEATPQVTTITTPTEIQKFIEKPIIVIAKEEELKPDVLEIVKPTLTKLELKSITTEQATQEIKQKLVKYSEGLQKIEVQQPRKVAVIKQVGTEGRFQYEMKQKTKRIPSKVEKKVGFVVKKMFTSKKAEAGMVQEFAPLQTQPEIVIAQREKPIIRVQLVDVRGRFVKPVFSAQDFQVLSEKAFPPSQFSSFPIITNIPQKIEQRIGAESITATKPVIAQIPEFRLDQDLRQRIIQQQQQETKQKVVQEQKIVQVQQPAQIVSQIQTPVQTQVQLQQQITTPITTITVPPPFIPTPSIPFIPPPIIPFGFSTQIPGGGISSPLFQPPRYYRQKTRYTPTATAAFLSIKGKESKAQTATGISFRPILSTPTKAKSEFMLPKKQTQKRVKKRSKDITTNFSNLKIGSSIGKKNKFSEFKL